MRKIILGLLALLSSFPAFGQGGIANFPTTVPAQTIVGRLGIAPGPTQAIPITSLAAIFGAKQSVTTNAKCDGATDDTTAINADLAQGGYWTLPPNKTCNFPQLNITVSGTRLSGTGFNTSILQSTAANLPSINVSASLSNVYLDGFQVTKSGIATSGGTGIKMNGDCQYCVLQDVFVQKHFVGIALQSTGVGYVHRVLSQFNLSAGITITNSLVSGTAQWDLNDVFSAQNVGQGFIASTGAGAGGMTLGSWHNIRTFANTGVGVAFVGTATYPINGVRITKAFIGNDNNHGVFLDTYGGLHTIADSYVELSSTSASGPTLSTPSNNSGDGIRITANNTDVSISNAYINGNHDSGINTSATVITNVSGYHNSNHSLNGIVAANCALLTVTSVNFITNGTNINCTSNSGSQLVATSTPSSLNTYLTSPIPANSVTRAMEAQGVARSVIGVTGNATANVADIQGTADQALVVNSAGTALAFGKVNLTAGAGATGTLPVANGGTGDTGTAWTTFVPAFSCGTATFTVNSARFKTLGKAVWFSIDATITVIGTCTTSMTFTLPATAQSGAGWGGREQGSTGKGAVASVAAASATATIVMSDLSAFNVNARIFMAGTFESQ